MTLGLRSFVNDLKRLVRDEEGAASALTNVLMLITVAPVGVGMSLVTMQLFQSSHHRDMIDHMASVAADSLTKSLCSNSKDFGGVPRGVFAGPRQTYVENQVRSRLSLAVPNEKCQVATKPAAGQATTPDPGSISMLVEISCDAPCSVPFGAQVMCNGSPRHLTLTASQTAVAMGCDAGEGW